MIMLCVIILCVVLYGVNVLILMMVSYWGVYGYYVLIDGYVYNLFTFILCV